MSFTLFFPIHQDGETHCECRSPPLLAVHGDLAVHHLQNAQSQGQPQAVPLRGVRGIPLIKLVKNMSLCPFRYPASGVGYRHKNGVLVRGLAQGHRPARSGKFEGVGQQVVPDQLHEAGVRLNDGPVLQLGVKFDPFLLPNRFKGRAHSLSWRHRS